MWPPDVANFTDRGAAINRILNGASNTILFTHTYALCGRRTRSPPGAMAPALKLAFCGAHFSTLVAGILPQANLHDCAGAAPFRFSRILTTKNAS